MHVNRVYLSQQALIHNHTELQRLHPNASICPVLKSNAYGHGLHRFASMCRKLNVPYFITNSLEEAVETHRIVPAQKILVMGYVPPESFMHAHYDFDFAIFDTQVAEAMHMTGKTYNVHVFVDTGMHREGVLLSKLAPFLSQLRAYSNIHVIGLCSHLADADNPTTRKHANSQLTNYQDALKIFYTIFGHEPKWRHVQASAGSITTDDKSFNLIRGGLAHYGIHPLAENDPHYATVRLKPVLELWSTIVQTKHIREGDCIGYNCTFTAKQSMYIGLLPLGYYEGVDRRLSNNGIIRINNKYAPIIGRVSMNMTVVDLTHLPEVNTGQDVIIYSANHNHNNSLYKSALRAGTIPYELLVHIPDAVERIVI